VSAGDWAAIIGAVLAGVGGIITAWAALVRARAEGDHDCQEQLKTLRAENEQVADELHGLRMKKAAG
jgi:hypothetical protein